MHRYSPVRTQRSKGFKIKHVLRICFLIVVCCWLIFQIKRSHYKRIGPIDTEILSSTKSIHEVIKLGRKDIQLKETETHEEEEDEDEEHEIEEEEKIEDEKDDEIDETEQYKFNDDDDDDDTGNESEEKDGQSQTANEAREEHYKADDASSAVTHEHEAQALDNSGGFLETTAKFQETGSGSTDKANNSTDHVHNNSGSTRVMEELETSLESTNMSAVGESQTILTTKENDSNSSQTEDETEDPDEFHQDAIDSTDFIRLEDLEALDNSEDTAAE